MHIISSAFSIELSKSGDAACGSAPMAMESLSFGGTGAPILEEELAGTGAEKQ